MAAFPRTPTTRDRPGPSPALALLLASTLLAALLAGCAASIPPSATSGTVPIADAATIASHKAAQRTDGPVTTRLDTTGYVATQTITVTNDVTGFLGARVNLSVPAGSIDAKEGDAGKYTLTLVLTARALTESQARDALHTMHAYDHDSIKDGILDYGLGVRFDPQDQGAVGNAPSRSAALTAALGRAMAHELEMDGASANLQATGLGGPALDASTASGDVTAKGVSFAAARLESASGHVRFDGTAARLEASATSGNVDVEARAAAAELSSTSGSVTAKLTPTATGTFSADSVSGSARITLARAGGLAYDAASESTSGTATVKLHDATTATDNGPGHSEASARSPGFDQASIRATVTAKAVSGDADIHD